MSVLAIALLVLRISTVGAEQYGSPDRRDEPPKVEPKIFIETPGIVGLNFYDEESFEAHGRLDPRRFTVQSKRDPYYQTPRHPLKVGRWSRGYDMLIGKRGFGALKLHTIYLVLPRPLKSGRPYEIRVRDIQDRKPISLAYRGDLHTSAAVKVNQYGYLPQEAVKIAYVGDWLGSLGTLELKDRLGDFYLYDLDTRKRVFTGRAASRAVAREMHGEELHELDFSPFKTPGRYVVVVPGVGASFEFRIARDVYQEIATLAFRSLYHQRCGIALTPEFTRWVRPSPCHRGRVEISGYKQFVNSNPFQELPRQATGRYLKNVWGGYHDAGDYDRDSRHFVVATKLLEIYEAFPDAFADKQFNIPESGNGVPDILDEARWVIDWGIRMQGADGGVRGMIETTEHPNWGVGPDSARENAQPMYVTQPEPMSSLLFAAPAAKLARAFKRAGQKAAVARYLKHARKAYAYAKRNAAALKVADVDKPAQPDDLWAQGAIELYRATGEKRYHRDFLKHFRLLEDAEIDLAGWSDWRLQYATFSYATAGEIELDARALEVARRALRRAAEKMLGFIGQYGYRVARYNPEIWWGFGGAADYHEPLMRAYLALGEKRYRDAMVHEADTWLGVNPLNMCWITGVGKRSPVNNLHIPQMTDGIPEPVPGIMVFGPQSPDTAKEDAWMRDHYFGTMFPSAEQIPKLRCFADMYPFASATEFRMDVYQVQMVALMLFMNAAGQAGT